MKYQLKVFSALVATSLFLTACNSKFDEEAERVNKLKNEAKETSSKDSDQEQLKEQYKEMEKPLDEVIMENDLDKVQEVPSIEVEVKSEYQDPVEFSKFVSQKLYNFYISQITPEEYYKFLTEYGSERVISELPTEKDAISILKSIQDMFKQQNITGESYTLTNIALNRLKNEGSFYRKVITTNGDEYFVTIIKKEDGLWKYEDDGPAPPYLIGSDLPEVSENVQENEQ